MEALAETIAAGSPTEPRHVVHYLDQHNRPVCAEHVPAPDYLAGDRKAFGAEGMGLGFAVRPFGYADMLPNFSYLPGSVLISRHWPQFAMVCRIVARVDEGVRADAMLALHAVLRDSESRGDGLMPFLQGMARLETATPPSEMKTPIEGSRIVTFI